MPLYSKTNVLKKFFLLHREYGVMGTSKSNFERLFLGKQWKYFLISNCNGTSDSGEMVHFRNDDKRLSIDGENRFFHIRVTFSNLRDPQFCIEDKFWKL